jgi:hypothetical protein
MTELAAISFERHAEKGWNHDGDYAFVAEEAAVPIIGAELNKIALGMPIGFVILDVGYQLVAITSLQPGTNLYVAQNGKWIGDYIPAVLRAYPFQLAQQEGAEDFILCVNEASGLLVEREDDGNAFFDDQDQPTQEIKDILNFVTNIKAGREVTQEGVNSLAEAGVITPWKINLNNGEKVVPVEGLFRIDEVALKKLDDEGFLAVREAGGLPIAYTQLFSMNQLAVLERLSELRIQITELQTANSEAANLTGFSLSEDEGSLIFE